MPGLALPEYRPDWSRHGAADDRLRVGLSQYALETGVPMPGDLALFRWFRCPDHVAIVVCWPVIVHAYARAGQVVLDDVERNAELAARLVSCWRLEVLA